MIAVAAALILLRQPFAYRDICTFSQYLKNKVMKNVF